MLGRGGLKEDDVALSVACVLISHGEYGKRLLPERTKGNIAVSHPRRNANLIIGREACHLVASEEIPHNGSASRIVTHNQTAGAALADSVGGNPRDVLTMPGKSSLNGQGVMVEAKDDIALGIQQERGRGGAGLKGELVAPRRDARGGRLVLDV